MLDGCTISTPGCKNVTLPTVQVVKRAPVAVVLGVDFLCVSRINIQPGLEFYSFGCNAEVRRFKRCEVDWGGWVQSADATRWTVLEKPRTVLGRDGVTIGWEKETGNEKKYFS